MDDRLADHYLTELNHVRSLCDGFAQGHPHARYLRTRQDGCPDPFVERLLEGFAYLSARVQAKFDAQYPRFTQQVLDVVCPNDLAPTPSMMVVAFTPAPQVSLRAGLAAVARDSEVVAESSASPTPCVYRTAHDVPLWPLEVTAARYVTRDVPLLRLPGDGGDAPPPRAAVLLTVRTTDDGPLNGLAGLDRLAVYLHGQDRFQLRLYKQLVGDRLGVAAAAVGPGGRRGPWVTAPRASTEPMGFDLAQHLLPADPRSFQGYRLLQEYFAFRQRFLFVELTGLGDLLAGCDGAEAELAIPLREADPELEPDVSADAFRLFCTPAVNLFPVRNARVNLGRATAEHLVELDGHAPDDHEVFKVDAVGGPDGKPFAPFYAAGDVGGESGRYYTVNRVPSLRRRPGSPRDDYRGADVYLGLVDAADAPYPADLKWLRVAATCTNRDLPLHLDMRHGEVQVRWDHGGVVDAVRCLTGATRPRPSAATGPFAWRLVDHMTLNYLSIADRQDGAAGLRDLLSLYGGGGRGDEAAAEAAAAVLSVRSAPVTVRLPAASPDDWQAAFARGVEVRVRLAEPAFDAGWAYLLGSVLSHFFARYASINSLVRLVVWGQWKDKPMEFAWPAIPGRATSF